MTFILIYACIIITEFFKGDHVPDGFNKGILLSVQIEKERNFF
jgi:hypothetical protein